MKIAFFQDNGLNESVAMLVLAANLRARGHVPRLFIEEDEPHLLREVQRFDADLLVLAIDIGGQHWGAGMVQRLTGALPTPLLVVGSWSTLCLEHVLALPSVSLIIPGECDIAIPALVDALLAKQPDLASVPGLVWRDAAGEVHRNAPPLFLQDLDAQPAPDLSLYDPYPYLQRFGVRRFVSGRGCVNRCTYCYNGGMATAMRSLGPYVRRKSPAAFVREIADTVARYPTEHVHMGDDLFTANLAWLKEFAPLYRRDVGIPFTCNGHPNTLSEAAVASLHLAGCHGVAVGIESGDEALRRRILDRALPNQEILEACQRVRQAGIMLATFNMLAMPGETLDQALATVRFNQEIGAQVPRVNFTFPLRGTPLTATALAEGHLTDADLVEFERQVAEGAVHLKPVYRSPDAPRLARLFYLFHAAILAGVSEKWLRRALELPIEAKPAMLAVLANEKRFFRIRWLPGLRMFQHAGHPALRTKNFNNFVP